MRSWIFFGTVTASWRHWRFHLSASSGGGLRPSGPGSTPFLRLAVGDLGRLLFGRAVAAEGFVDRWALDRCVFLAGHYRFPFFGGILCCLASAFRFAFSLPRCFFVLPLTGASSATPLLPAGSCSSVPACDGPEGAACRW